MENIDRDLEARDGYYYTTYGKHIVAEYRKGLLCNQSGFFVRKRTILKTITVQKYI